MTDKQERVYLVATGETVDGRETYTRHDSLPPMCDFETLFSAPPAQPADIGNTISSKTPEPNEENPYVLWREIHRLRTEVQGPSGFATWQDAAVAERVRRVKAEQELRAAQPAPAQEPQPVSNTDELPQRLSDERIMHFWDIHAGMPTEKYPLNYKDVRAFARAIEAAIVPQWMPIESAPKDGTRIILGSSDGAWMAEYQPVYQSGYRPDNPWFSVMLNHAHMGRFPKAKPTHWQPIPPAPKATK